MIKRKQSYLGMSGTPELQDLEIAILRLRRAYMRRGYSPRWIDKRLRGVSTRHEVTGEWSRRGVGESDQYRALTNALMEGAFGMDVEQMRRYKNLLGTRANLRDYMSDLELVLVALGETAAVALSRNRGSHGIEQLLADVQDAGRIAGEARQQIEQGSAKRPVAPRHEVERFIGGAESSRRSAEPTSAS